MKFIMRQKNGSSLVEVLLVIVILLIGVLSAYRIFPRGFDSLKKSNEFTLATRLASSELERLKLRVDNIPEAIYSIKYGADNSGNIVLLANPDANPDDFTVDQISVDNGGAPLYFSDINKIRRVVGEPVQIPSPRMIGPNSQATSVYVLNFGPVVTSNDAIFVVYGNRLREIEIDYDPSNPNTSFGRFLGWAYAMDYDLGKTPADAWIGLPISSNRDLKYRLAFVYAANVNGKTIHRYVVDKIVDVPATADSMAWFNMQDLLDATDKPNYQYIIPGSVKASIAFNRLALTDDFNPDWPYEYKLDPAKPWVINFNPYGYNYLVPVSRFERKPLVANISYDILDWHILRDERIVPDNGDVKLTLGDVKKVGEENEDRSGYTGLADFAPYQNNDVIIIDSSTGEQLAQNEYTVDYMGGWIKFNLSHVGKSFRIMYKAYGNWGVQVQAPALSYVEAYSNVLTVGQYFIGRSDGLSGNASRIYFPTCDTGKQVVLQEYYYTDGTSLNRASAESYIIKEDDSADNLPYPFIDITDRHPGSNIAFDWSMGYAVKGVVGSSIRIRAIWGQDGKRWRKHDLDSVLMRSDTLN